MRHAHPDCPVLPSGDAAPEQGRTVSVVLWRRVRRACPGLYTVADLELHSRPCYMCGSYSGEMWDIRRAGIILESWGYFRKARERALEIANQNASSPNIKGRHAED